MQICNRRTLEFTCGLYCRLYNACQTPLLPISDSEFGIRSSMYLDNWLGRTHKFIIAFNVYILIWRWSLFWYAFGFLHAVKKVYVSLDLIYLTWWWHFHSLCGSPDRLFLIVGCDKVKYFPFVSLSFVLENGVTYYSALSRGLSPTFAWRSKLKCMLWPIIMSVETCISFTIIFLFN